LGFTETLNIDGYTFDIDLVAADAPSAGAFGSDRFVSTAILSLDVTISVNSPSMPFTTNSNFYPMNIQIDNEILTITGAPVSTAQPQSLSVTRAVSGTAAAAHALNAVVRTSYEVDNIPRTILGTNTTTLASNIGSAATSLTVALTGAAFSTTAVPYDIVIDGERMTVTAAAAPTSSQVLTVTRGVAPTVAVLHKAGASVNIYNGAKAAH
jgi:hypothetical protein